MDPELIFPLVYRKEILILYQFSFCYSCEYFILYIKTHILLTLKVTEYIILIFPQNLELKIHTA